MRITVIVPVRNEAAAIEATLRALLTQDYPDFEVIVADGQSDDETVAVARRLQGEFGNLKVLYNPRRWSSAARNLGVRHATGDAVIVVDGHCTLPGQDYLRRAAEAFAASGAATLGRPQPLTVEGATPFQVALAAARQSKLGHNPDSDIFSDRPGFVDPQNVAVAYRREVFRRVGLFDERFDACEDVEFNTRVGRAGLDCYFEPRIAAVYHPRRSPAALFKQLARYGAGRARLAVKFPDSLTLPALAVPLWAAWLALGWLPGLLWPPALWLYAASAGLYAAAVLAFSAGLAVRLPRPAARHLPAVFVTVHLGFGWGFLREAGRQIIRANWSKTFAAVGVSIVRIITRRRTYEYGGRVDREEVRAV